MDPMRKVGYFLIIPGAIMLVIMILPFFVGIMIPRGGLPWTYTWSSILGLFFFMSGLALLWITGGIRAKGEKDPERKYYK
jgi:hypothetical protein